MNFQVAFVIGLLSTQIEQYLAESHSLPLPITFFSLFDTEFWGKAKIIVSEIMEEVPFLPFSDPPNIF